MVVDVHTHAPLRWLMPDYHAGVRPGAQVKLDFTFEPAASPRGGDRGDHQP